MSSLESAATDEETPLEFASKEEEDAYFAKISKQRNAEAGQRRMTMMGGLGIQGPQEHCAFFKLNPNTPDCPAELAKRIGKLLSTIQQGILGASFRPLVSGEFEWILKIQFKSVEDVETYYGLIEDMMGSGEDLVTDSIIVDLSGLRGSITPGVGEVLALMKVEEGSQDGENVLEGVESAGPAGMTNSSVRPIHQNGALFTDYETMQPGYTHAMMVNFEKAEDLNAYMGSGALAGIVGASPVSSADPKAVVFAYVF